MYLTLIINHGNHYQFSKFRMFEENTCFKIRQHFRIVFIYLFIYFIYLGFYSKYLDRPTYMTWQI